MNFGNRHVGSEPDHVARALDAGLDPSTVTTIATVEAMKAPSIFEADKILLALLGVVIAVAQWLKLSRVEKIAGYLVEAEDERRFLLDMAGLEDRDPSTPAPVHISRLGLFGGETIGQLLEVAALVRQWAPWIKEHGPQIKQAIATIRMIVEVLRSLSSSSKSDGGGTTKPSEPVAPNLGDILKGEKDLQPLPDRPVFGALDVDNGDGEKAVA